MFASSSPTAKSVRNQLVQDASGEEGRYTGPLDEALPHGSKGDMTYPNGRTYQGDWMFGKWHGHGVAHFPNGDSYKGEYRCDERHGSGIYRWKDGRSYDGMFHKDVRHGQGIYKWPKTDGNSGGMEYEGTFERGQRQGQGTYTFKGGKYVGDFEQGLYHGYGECTWDDGRTYKGEWINGMAHGMGIETDALGRILHQGAWHEDEPILSKQTKRASMTVPALPKASSSEEQKNGASMPSFSNPFESFTRMLTLPSLQRKDSTDANHNKKPLAPIGKNQPATTPPSTPPPSFASSSPFDALGRILKPGIPPPPLASKDDVPVAVAVVVEEETLKPVVNEMLKDSRGRSGSFRGMVLRGLPHGVGHMVYDTKNTAACQIDTYQGFWDYGDWKQGRVEYRNGDIYHGDFTGHNLRTGAGHYIWSDGRQYQGEWKDDQRHGQGQFHYPNGDTFEGTFVHGQRQGHGRFEFHDGSMFEGGFEKSQFHGPGCKYIHKDGRVYMGDFLDGERSGYGKELYPNGSLRYEGEWANDEPLQLAKIQPTPPGFVLQEGDDDDDAMMMDESIRTTASTSSLPLIVQETKDCKTVVEESIKDAQNNLGCFTGLVSKEGFPHGVGRMVYTGEIREGFWKHGYLEGHARAFFANGDFYEGIFSKSQREGKGVYKWKDGRVYEGDYVNDQRHGLGRFVYPSGDEYVGQYDQGMRSGGTGKFTFADGSSYNGAWHNSLYHGYGELKEVNGNCYKGEWKESNKHGKGEQYKDNKWIKGEWEDNVFIKETTTTTRTTDDASDDNHEKKLQELVIDESPNTRKQSFRWGSMDFENRRWEPVEEKLNESGISDDGGEDFQDDEIKGDNDDEPAVTTKDDADDAVSTEPANQEAAAGAIEQEAALSSDKEEEQPEEEDAISVNDEPVDDEVKDVSVASSSQHDDDKDAKDAKDAQDAKDAKDAQDAKEAEEEEPVVDQTQDEDDVPDEAPSTGAKDDGDWLQVTESS